LSHRASSIVAIERGCFALRLPRRGRRARGGVPVGGPLRLSRVPERVVPTHGRRRQTPAGRAALHRATRAGEWRYRRACPLLKPCGGLRPSASGDLEFGPIVASGIEVPYMLVSPV
jgi:hypothetical protein